MIKPYTKAWDLHLPYADFAYNKAPRKVISLSTFKVVHRIDALSPPDLTPSPLYRKRCVNAVVRVEEI